MTSEQGVSVVVPVELVKFLLGEGPIDDLWFGDERVLGGGRVGRYWWRTALRECLPASPAGSGQVSSDLKGSDTQPGADGAVVAFGHFQRGAQACREMMARFVEATHPEIAQSIRLNWHPGWGSDPGKPPFVAATWEPEECPVGEAAYQKNAAEDRAAAEPDLAATATMLETWGPLVEPASPNGQVSFTRAMMASAAETIRAALSAATTDQRGGDEAKRSEPDKQPAPAPVGWRPIETAPRDGSKVIGQAASGDVYRMWWHEFEEGCDWQDDADSEVRPLHWMPLPPAPDTASKAGEGEDA
ncbi:hypothetical protein [Brevundimonas sp. LjRoot202]|uniref:hypothetical protein n=1 Tax=Brevundimonas sp. LjRoot202 TaxID=3342281 RepID=UPI003ECEAC7C